MSDGPVTRFRHPWWAHKPPFSNFDVDLCEKEASDSLKEFDRINQKQEIAFDEFVNSYNSKI